MVWSTLNESVTMRCCAFFLLRFSFICVLDCSCPLERSALIICDRISAMFEDIYMCNLLAVFVV